MLAATRCQVCDGSSRRELLVFPNDPYLRRLPSRTDHSVRYVVCTDCGFVYQEQMMDAAEMDQLYGKAYRPPHPTPNYLQENRAIALEVFSWISRHTGLRGTSRRVLDIGCAAGTFLRPFAQTGWRAVGLDAGSNWIEYGRRKFGLDLRAEFFTRESLPGEQFDLVIFSHVLEHVLGPAPVLAAIREKLTDEGYLFIGTPNVLAPNRKLYPGLFGGDHVRLFSPRTLAAYLRRHGFRAVTIETVQPRGLRALAIKADSVTAPDLCDRDDWAMILALYRGILSPEEGSILEKNLATLARNQEPVIEEACRRLGTRLYSLGINGQEVDNLAITNAEGTVTWLYGAEGSQARSRRALATLPDRLPSWFVLFGLGLGHFAELLAARLGTNGRLLIWEADPVLCATALQSRDLTDLIRSPRVTLHVGPDLRLLQRMAPRQFVTLGDPSEAPARSPIYQESLVWVREAFGKAKPSLLPVGAQAGP